MQRWLNVLTGCLGKRGIFFSMRLGCRGFRQLDRRDVAAPQTEVPIKRAFPIPVFRKLPDHVTIATSGVRQIKGEFHAAVESFELTCRQRNFVGLCERLKVAMARADPRGRFHLLLSRDHQCRKVLLSRLQTLLKMPLIN